MSRDELRALLRERLGTVEERLTAASTRAGRRRDEVRLVAVTKMVGPEVAGLLPELGVLDLGESRPQELWTKAAALPTTVRWHLIGHLQRNKVERTLPLVNLLHSVDSLRLLGEIEQEAGRQGHTVAALLEVNISGEVNKNGFAPGEVLGLWEHFDALTHVRIEGLMGMAAFEEDPQRCRPAFATLRELRDRLRPRLGEGHLSMGMTNDFEVAIEEGATLVRLGSVLFEGLDGAIPI
jgi:pyridoxal phosphate enzyme (YggS family)